MSGFGVPGALKALFDETEEDGCGCRPEFEGDRLAVDASDCEHGGRLEASPACRRATIEALTARDVDTVWTTAEGVERVYDGTAAALLVAAGRFRERVACHDERLADRTATDPLGAALEATGRAGPVADIAATTGLAELTARVEEYEAALSPSVGPTVSRWRVDVTPPRGGRLVSVRELETGATVRRYERRRGPDLYALEPIENGFEAAELSLLDRAYRGLADGQFEGGSRAPARAVEAAVTAGDGTGSESLRVETVADVLRKHARGYGLLEDLFGDPRLSDAFVTAPATTNPLRVRVEDETLVTNVRLTDRGVDALASRFRRESGRAFSRADPTLDATAEVGSRRVRVAGVTEPTSDGTAFAFRAHGREAWTLPALVENDTVSTEAAAVLSVAVDRGRSILLTGPRGAGKTTMLGALLWEVSPAVRIVVIEDTPELPVGALQDSHRDVQALHTGGSRGEVSPAEALRTALRLGDGALAVGEVRGEEAQVLYEAMRVGANSETVLGTIHGDGGDGVFERVVSDLGVPASSFGVTDLLVTLERTGGGTRRVRLVEEVGDGKDPSFDPLFERGEDRLVRTGRIDRGNSTLVAAMTEPDETYADLREIFERRERLLGALASRGRTGDGAAVLAGDRDDPTVPIRGDAET